MKKFIFGFIVLALSMSTVAHAQITVSPGFITPGKACFSGNLTVGSTGEMVRELQKFLNSDPSTRVAVSGAGSAGNESTYFGPATRAAVIKFQNKFGAEVLTPAGLASGNGFVGALTRAKLNVLRGCNENGQATTISVTTDKKTYAVNEDIKITVTARNNANAPKTLNFSSGCQADYSIPTAQYSIEKICTLALTSVTLGPKESKSWEFTHTAALKSLSAGTHTIRGTVIGYGSADTSITVGSSSAITILPNITVVTPNGGEVWSRGELKSILWSTGLPKGYTDFSGIKLDVSVVKYSQPCTTSPCPAYPAIAPYPIAKGVGVMQPVSWKVGDTLDLLRTIPAGTYQVQVCVSGSTEGCDLSNSPFTIQ